MKRLIILGALLLLAACAPSNKTTGAKTAQDYVDEYGGSVSAYREILASSDCADLQAKFDQASANNYAVQPGTPAFSASTGFMAAADARMKAVGCYH